MAITVLNIEKPTHARTHNSPKLLERDPTTDKSIDPHKYYCSIEQEKNHCSADTYERARASV